MYPRKLAFEALLNVKSSWHLLFKKTARTGSYYKTAACTVDYRYTTTCMGKSMIQLCSIMSFLPSLYPLCHSHDKLFPTIYCFSIFQVTEDWAGLETKLVQPLSHRSASCERIFSLEAVCMNMLNPTHPPGHTCQQMAEILHLKVTHFTHSLL